MNPQVRDLYKRLLLVSRDYPRGYAYCQPKLHNAFKQTPINNDSELNAALAKGEYIYNEMIALIQLRKYREMKRRYGSKQYSVDENDLLQYINESLPRTSVTHDTH